MRPATRPTTTPNHSAEFPGITAELQTPDPLISVIGSTEEEVNARLAQYMRILDHVSPELEKGEFRVLIHLMMKSAQHAHDSAQSGIEDLEKATKLARTSVVRATGSLKRRGMIVYRRGKKGTKSAYLLAVAQTKIMPRKFCSDTLQKPFDFGPDCCSDSLQHKATAFDETPIFCSVSLQNPLIRTAGASTRVDSIDKTKAIDRVNQARPEDQNPEDMAQIRRWIHSYQAKASGRDPGPPPDDILAQLLTIAPASRITGLVEELMGDPSRPIGEKYIWFVTIALQRILKISPADQKAARGKLRAVASQQRRPDNPPPPPASMQATQQEPEPQPEADTLFSGAIMQQIRQGGKSF